MFILPAGQKTGVLNNWGTPDGPWRSFRRSLILETGDLNVRPEETGDLNVRPEETGVLNGRPEETGEMNGHRPDRCPPPMRTMPSARHLVSGPRHPASPHHPRPDPRHMASGPRHPTPGRRRPCQMHGIRIPSIRRQSSRPRPPPPTAWAAQAWG